MKKITIAALVVCALTATVGCKKTVENTTPPPYYQVTKELTDILLLSAGKYFVYKDSVTGLEDSVVVKESSIEKVFVPTHVEYSRRVGTYMAFDAYADTFRLRMTNESANGKPDWLLISHIQKNDLNDDNIYYCSKDGKELDPVLWLPASPVVTDSGRGGAFILPAIQVENITYPNVYVIRNTIVNTAPFIGGVRTSEFYWVKGIGLIKRVIKDNTEPHSWTLLRKG
jgi:hypothetical protein